MTVALVNVTNVTMSPSSANAGLGFLMTNPGSRVGYLERSSFGAGTIQCFPRMEDAAATVPSIRAILGSLLYPDGTNCNPEGLLVCTKVGFAPVPLYPLADHSNRKMAVLMHKVTWCVSSICPSPPCPAKCYTYKTGRCYRFTANVMPEYDTNAGRTHSVTAFAQFVAGNLAGDGLCTAMGNAAAAQAIAGN